MPLFSTGALSTSPTRKLLVFGKSRTVYAIASNQPKAKRHRCSFASFNTQVVHSHWHCLHKVYGRSKRSISTGAQGAHIIVTAQAQLLLTVIVSSWLQFELQKWFSHKLTPQRGVIHVGKLAKQHNVKTPYSVLPYTTGLIKLDVVPMTCQQEATLSKLGPKDPRSRR